MFTFAQLQPKHQSVYMNVYTTKGLAIYLCTIILCIFISTGILGMQTMQLLAAHGGLNHCITIVVHQLYMQMPLVYSTNCIMLLLGHYPTNTLLLQALKMLTKHLL